MEAVQVFAGSGDYEGFLRSQKHSTSEPVAGVATVKLAYGEASAVPAAADIIEPDGSRLSTSEEYLLAFDTAGNLRVLKHVYGGSVTYECERRGRSEVARSRFGRHAGVCQVSGSVVLVSCAISSLNFEFE